ncbi:ribose ABC transporter permease [Streptococcus pseudopneumoniae]|uniref:ABC transporter permease subunit n=1 Tax=Streptococcus TaxID=1301 RepID=UPI00025B4AEA|nr:ribose ABC transporter permease [Streptococcus pseudopneumoniae]EID69532.1 branched-chain amino acid ABC transporter, permease protein [Streptococcus pseudopneumoniae SK674]MBF9605818.1 ribose ABC transporter permease [Streptococcus pseudopneumoniae]MBF9635518.1 ribose ABC transporter permease [Streptococcus pseudopneumoniae]MBF9637973.1 ribose ABC transporter permease [Streptococcus pseudopneumoniae]MBF9639878.1 ribose ABC transporter permease [Streptococcus pseudopneumoniae]
MKNTMKYMSELTTVIALIILMAVITIINSNFLTANNLLNLLLQVTSNALIAFGMTFVILTGGIDLSVGSILALSSALTAGLLGSGMTVTLAILISLILGCILGMMNGLLISYGKLAPFIVTLATMTIFRGATLVYTNGNPITKGLSDTFLFQFLGQGYIVGIPFPVIIMFIVFIVLYVLLHKTAFGKSVYAIGGNEKAAYISGVKLNKVKIIIYSISGMMASISGLIITSRLSSAQPTAGASYEMDAIAAVVLGGTSLSGGKGRILGTLIGALIIGVLNNGLNIIGVSAFWQQVVKGVVILIAVLIDRFKVVKQ